MFYVHASALTLSLCPTNRLVDNLFIPSVSYSAPSTVSDESKKREVRFLTFGPPRRGKKKVASS